jgi:pimeloyl-ACP methyl ester carboxylesterase
MNPYIAVRVVAFCLLLIGSVTAALPATHADDSVPPAVYMDPPHDARYPATMAVLHIPSHGVSINGVAYVPGGPGPHPVLVLCHGLPGNEKNLDLAQAVRRAGWVAVTFNYRGSWGSPGQFNFRGNLEDAAAVLSYLREPHNASALRADARHIAVAGHSMGGWIAARTSAGDPGVMGTVLISAWNPTVPTSHQATVKEMADDMESLVGVTPESMAAQLESLPKNLSLTDAAEGLKDRPLLVLTADDGLAPASAALVDAIRARGGSHVSSSHTATDHSWSDRRIELETKVILWLQGLN